MKTTSTVLALAAALLLAPFASAATVQGASDLCYPSESPVCFVINCGLHGHCDELNEFEAEAKGSADLCAPWDSLVCIVFNCVVHRHCKWD